MGLLLLQSYSPEAATTTVSFPDGKLLVDAQSRETFAADAAGTVTLSLSADYGTRLLYVLRSPQEPKLLPVVPGTVLGEDFELGLGFNLGIRGSTFEVAADATTPGNHLLRITPGHPAQNVLRPQNVTIPANGDLSFRFRLPELPTTAGAGGLLHLGYHERDGQRYAFGLSLSRTQDGPARWTVAKPLLSLDGGKNEGYQSVLAATPSTAAADTAWHTLTIRTQGKRQQIRLDGQLLFEGEDDRLPDGGFSIAPGWGWELPIPYIELDDLRVSNTAPVAADK